MFISRQAKVLPMPGRITLLRLGSGFYQQPAHQRIALLGDVTQASRVRAGSFLRDQSEIAGYVFAAREFPVSSRSFLQLLPRGYRVSLKAGKAGNNSGRQSCKALTNAGKPKSPGKLLAFARMPGPMPIAFRWRWRSPSASAAITSTPSSMVRPKKKASRGRVILT